MLSVRGDRFWIFDTEVREVSVWRTILYPDTFDGDLESCREASIWSTERNIQLLIATFHGRATLCIFLKTPSYYTLRSILYVVSKRVKMKATNCLNGIPLRCPFVLKPRVIRCFYEAKEKLATVQKFHDVSTFHSDVASPHFLIPYVVAENLFRLAVIANPFSCDLVSQCSLCTGKYLRLDVCAGNG